MSSVFSLKVGGLEEDVSSFSDYLKENGVFVQIGLRSSLKEDVILHLLVNAELVNLSVIINKWFKVNSDIVVISGDKDSVGMREMEEVYFSFGDSTPEILQKLRDLDDRQKHYDSNNKKSFFSWKKGGNL
ncbi:MAG: hypothetical protein AABW73_05210 [Nanoarchaeota archaeon]